VACSVFDRVAWLAEAGLLSDGRFCTISVVNPHPVGCIHRSIWRGLESVIHFAVPKGPAADHGDHA